MIDKIEKKKVTLVEIGYEKDGEQVYYADKYARDNLKTLKQEVLNLNGKEMVLVTKVEDLENRVNALTATTNCVPKDLNKLTNEVKSEQINMKEKDLYLYVNDCRDGENKASKVNIIELGKIHNKLTPLVRTIDTESAFDMIKGNLQDGEYIYKSAEIQEK